MEFNPQKQLAGLLEWMDQQMTQWRRWLWPPMAGRTYTAC